MASVDYIYRLHSSRSTNKYKISSKNGENERTISITKKSIAHARITAGSIFQQCQQCVLDFARILTILVRCTVHWHVHLFAGEPVCNRFFKARKFNTEPELHLNRTNNSWIDQDGLFGHASMPKKSAHPRLFFFFS
jgi:hypothetical protein